MSGGGGDSSGGWVVVPQPAGSFVSSQDMEREDHWSSFDDSVNAVSFGFVATAILISMFLLMAIFEKFLRARSAAQQPATQTVADIESDQREWHGKLGHPSPKAAVYAKEVSVVMPGEQVPTFIAHPAPPPCPPERISWPLHFHRSPCPCPCPGSPSATTTHPQAARNALS
ncbi:hypothetical protein SAY86_018431 [Trapa natans]|uniref:Uncharacterized protein n=1 Tax=Trapa natans TaxID=22666 RepID=A0AAN7LA75_TRANT|nr:hypothetical protein SAY86_018431 [Trapa natans]